ncbi:MAG: hypothetical protein II723_08675, partial [Oscillospiraceae bacterium]|nr:hypothetical protein [Oscillospiraceae bacterium]
IFTLMYNLDERFVPEEFQNIDEMFPRREIRRLRRPNGELPIPMRIYNTEILDYFKIAIYASDPFIQYISYYHVIEYYFDDVFDEHLMSVIVNKITMPDFSIHNKKKILEIARAIRKTKNENESAQGNELETLEYVLEKHIADNAMTDFKNRINDLSKDAVSFYQNNMVVFSKAPQLPWEANNLRKKLAERIYKTRNALIHSKSGKQDAIYKAAQHEEQLKKEIPLIRAVAEMIIINSAKIE